jgi:Domain of unknown function (DUF4365)
MATSSPTGEGVRRAHCAVGGGLAPVSGSLLTFERDGNRVRFTVERARLARAFTSSSRRPTSRVPRCSCRPSAPRSAMRWARPAKKPMRTAGGTRRPSAHGPSGSASGFRERVTARVISETLGRRRFARALGTHIPSAIAPARLYECSDWTTAWPLWSNQGMDPGQQKQQFSIAVVHAIASAAAVTMGHPMVDDDSIDVTFMSRENGRPRLEVQLKCTSVKSVGKAGFSYPLKLKNYNDLRVACTIPRLLVVVLVPGEASRWIGQTHAQTLLRRSAWFVSLLGLPDSSNTTTVSVTLPRENLFNALALRRLLGLERPL